jgi:type IV pilus assembly protein PilW
LLIALAIFGTMIGAIYRVFIAQARAYTVQDQVVEVQQDIRGAMELMLRDLRMAGFQTEAFNSPVITNTPIVTPLQNNSITVNYEYIVGVGATATKMINQVTYSLLAGAGGSLNLVYTLTQTPQAGPPVTTAETILQNVSALNFTYGIDQDHDGYMDGGCVAAANVPPGAKVVAVNVALTAMPTAVDPDVTTMVSPRTLTSTVTLRNMSFAASQAY